MDNYTRKNRRSIAVLAAVMVALTVMIVLNLTVRVPSLEPDIVCPMANAHIDWEQTHFPGTWGAR